MVRRAVTAQIRVRIPANPSLRVLLFAPAPDQSRSSRPVPDVCQTYMGGLLSVLARAVEQRLDVSQHERCLSEEVEVIVRLKDEGKIDTPRKNGMLDAIVQQRQQRSSTVTHVVGPSAQRQRLPAAGSPEAGGSQSAPSQPTSGKGVRYEWQLVREYSGPDAERAVLNFIDYRETKYLRQSAQKGGAVIYKCTGHVDCLHRYKTAPLQGGKVCSCNVHMPLHPALEALPPYHEFCTRHCYRLCLFVARTAHFLRLLRKNTSMLSNTTSTAQPC